MILNLACCKDNKTKLTGVASYNDKSHLFSIQEGMMMFFGIIRVVLRVLTRGGRPALDGDDFPH